MTQQFGVGAGYSENYGLVAYKGSKTLKQWGMTYTEDTGWMEAPSKNTCEIFLHNRLLDHWKDAIALGADRLGAYRDKCPIIYYDGKTFSQSVHTDTKATVSCGPGQVAYQHPDGSWGCKPVNEFEGAGCPPGQHWSAPLKKCIPYKQQVFKGYELTPQGQQSPYNRGGFFAQVHGVESEVDWDRTRNIVAGVDGLEVTFEQGDGTLGAAKLMYRQMTQLPQPVCVAISNYITNTCSSINALSTQIQQAGLTNEQIQGLSAAISAAVASLEALYQIATKYGCSPVPGCSFKGYELSPSRKPR